MGNKIYDVVKGACDERVISLTHQLIAEHAKTEHFYKFSLTMLEDGWKKQTFLHILRHLMRGPAGREVARRFGKEPLVIVNFCTLRCHNPGNPISDVKWHMDANLVGYEEDALVTWIPLHDIDGDRPGLQFLTWQGGVDRRVAWKKMVDRLSAEPDLVKTEQLPALLETCE